MKILRALKEEEEGVALIVVLCLAAVLVMAGLSVTWMTGNTAFVTRKVEKGVEALAVAEAGIAHMLNLLEDDGWDTYKTGALVNGNVGNGSYTVTTYMNPTNGFVLVTSTGVVGVDKRMTVVELLGDITEEWKAAVLEVALLSDGDIALKSAGITIIGDLMANGNVSGDGNATIDGDISAVGSIDPRISGDADTVVTEGAAPQPVVNYWDYADHYLDMATNGGAYYLGDQYWSGATITSSNGFIWVEGDCYIGHGPASTMTGTLVVNGTLTVDNRFETATIGTNPLFVVKQDIILKNRNNYIGYIWAGNNLECYNNRSLEGVLIAMNNIVIENNLDIKPPPYMLPLPTNDVDKLGVVVGGWLR